jgi:hypothetical protein
VVGPRFSRRAALARRVGAGYLSGSAEPRPAVEDAIKLSIAVEVRPAYSEDAMGAVNGRA